MGWMDGIAARSGGRTEILAPEIFQRCVDVWDVVATMTTVVALHAGSTNFSNAASEHQDFELRCFCSSAVEWPSLGPLVQHRHRFFVDWVCFTIVGVLSPSVLAGFRCNIVIMKVFCS